MKRRVHGGSAFGIVFVPKSLLEKSALLLASFAEHRPSEGVVYWFGLDQGSLSVVTTLVVPNADTTAGSVSTSAIANAEAQGAIVGTPLVLLGQAHTHSGSWTAHSDIDNTQTFARFDGAISIVVPYYGRYGIDLDDCSIYRHENGEFRAVAAGEREQHLRVLPGVCDYRTPLRTEHFHGH